MTREPGAPLDPAQALLHNSGAGPREVFRTPAIGSLVHFGLHPTLAGWTSARDGFDIDAEWPRNTVAAPPPLVARACETLLASLEVAAPARGGGSDAEHARRCLGALVRFLEATGRFRGLAGIASHGARASGMWIASGPGVTDLDLATTLAVYAVYAPPLVIPARTPSLRWFRADTVITLRRFRTAARGRRSA
jgi:hypothetical protein